MLPGQCRIRAMTMSSRLGRGSLAKRYEQDTDEESDEDGQFPGQEKHAAHITCNKENSSQRRTTRSVTRIRSRSYPAPTTVSNIDSENSEVDIWANLKHDALRTRRPTPPSTDQPEPAGRQRRRRRGAQLFRVGPGFGTTTVDSATAHRRRRRPCSG